VGSKMINLEAEYFHNQRFKVNQSILWSISLCPSKYWLRPQISSLKSVSAFSFKEYKKKLELVTSIYLYFHSYFLIPFKSVSEFHNKRKIWRALRPFVSSIFLVKFYLLIFNLWRHFESFSLFVFLTVNYSFQAELSQIE